MARNVKASKRGWGYDYANSRLNAYVDGAVAFHLNDAIGTQGLANPFLSIGTSTTSIDVTLTDHVVGFATWLKVVNSASKSLLGAYFRVDTDGTNAATSSQIVGCAMRCNVDQDISSAYSTQSHLTLGGSATIIAQEAFAGSFYLNAAGTTTAPRIGALLAIVSGTSAVTSSYYNVIHCIASGGVTIDAMIHIQTDSISTTIDGVFIDNNGGTMTNAIRVKGSVAVFADFDNASGEVCTEDGTVATTWSGRIKVITPNGSAGYVNIYSSRGT